MIIYHLETSVASPARAWDELVDADGRRWKRRLARARVGRTFPPSTANTHQTPRPRARGTNGNFLPNGGRQFASPARAWDERRIAIRCVPSAGQARRSPTARYPSTFDSLH